MRLGVIFILDSKRSPRQTMSSELSEVSTDALMREIQRRLDCQTKPDKRLILIGGLFLFFLFYFLFL